MKFFWNLPVFETWMFAAQCTSMSSFRVVLDLGGHNTWHASLKIICHCQNSEYIYFLLFIGTCIINHYLWPRRLPLFLYVNFGLISCFVILHLFFVYCYLLSYVAHLKCRIQSKLKMIKKSRFLLRTSYYNWKSFFFPSHFLFSFQHFQTHLHIFWITLFGFVRSYLFTFYSWKNKNIFTVVLFYFSEFIAE